MSIEPVMEERDETRFVGVSTQFDGADRQRNTLGDDIEDLWVRFLPVAGSIPEQVGGPYYGVIHDAGDGSDGLGYLASVASTVDEAPSGLDLVVVQPGRWAVFAHHGLPSDIDHTSTTSTAHGSSAHPTITPADPTWRSTAPTGSTLPPTPSSTTPFPFADHPLCAPTQEIPMHPNLPQPEQETTMELQHTTIDGRTIRYAASRQPGAPQLLLTSPQPMSVLTYGDWWDELCERFDVVAVDLPNHGGSDADKELTTVSQQAGFLPEILDHFDLANPHYVGPDIGTPIAVRFMADNPGRLRSAVLGDAGAVGHIEGELAFRFFVKSRLVRLLTLSAGGAIGGRIYCAAANRVGYKATKHPDKQRLADYRQGSTSFAKLRGQVGFLGSYPDETSALERVAPTIETPVLVLHGEHDTFVGIGNSRRLADALSNSEFHVIADAGHYSWEDNPEPYLAHVLAWIERAEAAIDT